MLSREKVSESETAGELLEVHSLHYDAHESAAAT